MFPNGNILLMLPNINLFPDNNLFRDYLSNLQILVGILIRAIGNNISKLFQTSNKFFK